MERKKPETDKIEALKKTGVLNPHPEKIKISRFLEEEFYDPYDLIQVKYEMLRQVQKEKRSVSEVAAAFGVSRLTYYRIKATFEQEGIAGLIPKTPGPKGAHKLSKEVMAFIEKAIEREPSLRARGLLPLIEKEFQLTIHPRSIEKALAKRKKKGGTSEGERIRFQTAR